MDEIFPILSGTAIGLIQAVIPANVRMLAFAVLVVAFGLLASWISGDLAISWVYALTDIAQVLGAALLTSVLVGRWRRRSWRLP